MLIERNDEHDVAVLDVEGRLVAGVGDVMLRESVNEALAGGHKKILVDLSKVTHIDSSGIGELVASRRVTNHFGGKLKLVRRRGGIDRVLTVSHILPLFDVHDTATAALAAFGDSGEEE